MARRHREKQPTEWGLYRLLDPHASVPMTLIKLRIKGAATCSVLATWRVAYSLSALLVVLPTDTLAISLPLSCTFSFTAPFSTPSKPTFSIKTQTAATTITRPSCSTLSLRRTEQHVLLLLSLFSHAPSPCCILPPWIDWRSNGERERTAARELNAAFSSLIVYLLAIVLCNAY